MDIDWQQAGAVINTGLTALKTASEIARTIKPGTNVDGDKVAQLNQMLADTQQSLIAANTQVLVTHEAFIAIHGTVKALQDELDQIKEVKLEKEDYVLHDAGSGAFVQRFNVVKDGAKPPHWICVDCFERGRKRILQNNGLDREANKTLFVCAEGHKITVKSGVSPTKTEEQVNEERKKISRIPPHRGGWSS